MTCLQINQWQKQHKNPGFEIYYYINRKDFKVSKPSKFFTQRNFSVLKCFLTRVVFGIRTLHSLEWFYVLQDVYQLPTHKNLSSIPPPCDTSKMFFTCKSLNTQGQGIDTCGKKLLPYTNLPLLIRN